MRQRCQGFSDGAADKASGWSRPQDETRSREYPLNLRSCVRAWSVLSIAWIVYCLWHSMLVCPLNRIGIQTPNALWCRFSEVDQLSYYGNLVLKMFGIPALVLVVLAAADWAWRGFRLTRSRSSP